MSGTRQGLKIGDERGVTVLALAAIGAVVVIALAGGLILMSRYETMRAQRDVARLQLAQLSARVSARAVVVRPQAGVVPQESVASRAAQAVVRVAVPAIEAYNADHSVGYAGVTLEKLQQSYDAGIRDVKIVRANATSYCIQSDTGGPPVYHKGGPSGQIEPGNC